MARPNTSGRPRRAPLSRQRALTAAIELADAEGIEALTMRKLAQSLGVEAMSLYHHVRNKNDILDGMVDMVFAEIKLPPEDATGGPGCACGPSRPRRPAPPSLGDRHH